MGRGCSTHGRNEKFLQNFGRKTSRKETLGRPRRRSENIRMDLWEIDVSGEDLPTRRRWPDTSGLG